MEYNYCNYPLQADGSINFESWAQQHFARQRSPAELQIILTACSLVKQYSQNYSTPYSDRCDYPGLMVAEILHTLKLDVNSIIIGIMYYAYSYTDLTVDIMQQHFGVEPIKLMEKLKHLDTISKNPFKVKRGAIPKDTICNLRNMLIAIVGDIRIILIKLAVHTCNMRLVSNKTSEIRQMLAYEARAVYAPLANRLGVGKIKKELEDLSFNFLEPEAYTNIIRLLDAGRVDRETYIAETINLLKEEFAKQQLSVEIQGRVKHVFSIWKKMQHKMLSYSELDDIHAVRILVETITDCYTALGIVHTLWKHIPKEFNDYIVCPKNNGYQSLHTTVIGPDSKIFEVQIRTQDMHKMAELGIAAHWRYKERGKANAMYDEKINYLRQIIAWQAELTNDLEIEEALKIALFEDRIYVFTPKGDVVDLPAGATAIDLAYHIHTDVGHRCRGAKVNGKIIPLSQPLTTGMQVEILTTKEGGPSRDWLNPHVKYLVTSKAKAKIHQWFRHQDREKNIQLGRDIINKEFGRLGIVKVKQKYSESTAQQLTTTKQIPIVIEGIGGLKYRIAKCCCPDLEDEIVGYVTLGNGVSIHKKDCFNILKNTNAQKNRFLKVSWKNVIDVCRIYPKE